MNSMIQTQLIKDILENNTLFKVEEINGKLEYKLDNSGEKIRICEINELEENPIYQNINDVCLFIGKGKTPKYVDTSSIEVIKSGQARGNYDFDFTNKYFMDEDSIDKTDDRILKYGDLVINTTGVGTVGRVTAYIIDEGLHTPDSHMCIMRSKKEVYFKYLLLNFLSIGFKKLESMAEGTGGQVELGISKIKGIPIHIPKGKEFNNEVYSSYQLQQSIAKNIEEKLSSLEYKINILKTMISLKKLEMDNILLNIFEKKLENYIIIDNNKIFLKDITYKQIKLYESKNIEEEFIATKRMGFTLPDDSISEIDFVEWLTIDDLNKVEGLYIEQLDTKTKISQEDVYSQYAEDSDKRKAIQIGDILVSFKMTIGVTKIYNSEQTAYCNEAIDIVNICDKEKYDSDYISSIIGNEYKKYTQNNVGSITLNNDLKDLIFLKIPEDKEINGNTIESIKIQKAIANFLNTYIKKINSNITNLNNLISLLNLAKESVLQKG